MPTAAGPTSGAQRATESLEIRPARLAEVDRLTALAHRAKAHWGYAPDLLELWRADLTYTAATLEEDQVFVAECAGAPIGVVSISYEGEVATLEGLWVDPSAMRGGAGRRLLAHAVAAARERGATSLVIDSDPHAAEFYLRMGARRAGTVPSRPAGRALPRLILDL